MDIRSDSPRSAMPATVDSGGSTPTSTADIKPALSPIGASGPSLTPAASPNRNNSVSPKPSKPSRPSSIADSSPVQASAPTPLPVPVPASPTVAGSPHHGRGAPSAPVIPAIIPANKILGRNSNNTVVMTSIPNNEAELQLYRVMQRASLLAYYDTLLEMGGDDVQQLCEAGEEEFLEIMALVGMASKPLHVRRLQKALQEWFNNPAQFQIPLGPSPLPGLPGAGALLTPGCPGAPAPLVTSARGPSPINNRSSPGVGGTGPDHAVLTAAAFGTSVSAVRGAVTPPSPDTVQASGSDLSVASSNQHPFHHNHPPLHHHHQQVSTAATSPGGQPPSPLLNPGRSLPAPLSSPTPRPGSPGLQLTPVLLESQIQRLAEAASSLAKSLPSYQPRPHNTKKKICKELELVLNMADDDPRRMDEIRKYAAIYGRFDCKRKPEKPLTLHEVSVNEAAAQICRFVPALLTRRDELFPLARQVVRDSGYLYSKGHANISCYRPRCPSVDDILTAGHKRPKLQDSQPAASPDSSDGERLRRQERLEAVSEELRVLSERTEDLVASNLHDVNSLQVMQGRLEALHARQAALQAEHADLLRQTLQPACRAFRLGGRATSLVDSDRPDTDDDSQLSFSNASSPLQLLEVGDSRDSDIGEKSRGTNRQEIVADMARDCRPPTGNGCSNFSETYFSESKVQVIASRGTDIIAVANPALSMSSTILGESRDMQNSTLLPAPGASPPSPHQVLKLEIQSPPPSPEKMQ